MRKFKFNPDNPIHDLYKAKAEYYEKLCAQLVDQLILAEVLVFDIEQNLVYWDATGETLGEDL